MVKSAAYFEFPQFVAYKRKQASEWGSELIDGVRGAGVIELCQSLSIWINILSVENSLLEKRKVQNNFMQQNQIFSLNIFGIFRFLFNKNNRKYIFSIFSSKQKFAQI